MLEMTENMVIGKTKTMKTERTEMVAFQKGIICSIKAVLQLWSDLKEEGFSYLLTHKLNQDCIENFFSLDFDDLEDWSSDSRDDVTNGI